jgi:trans-aconitate methyltransferase
MRSLMTTLIGLLRLNTKSKIIEAGCGPGLTTKLLTNDMSSNTIAYCVDLSPKM